MHVFRSSFSVLVLILCVSIALTSQVAVPTWHFDNGRSGANTHEAILTPSNVNFNQFGLLFSQSVDGGVVAEPLYVPNLTIGGNVHNVVFVVTMHDSVYAFDAASNTGSDASPLWKVNFTNPSAGVTTVPVSVVGCGNTTAFTELGIVGTPAIDTKKGIIYLVAETYENKAVVHRLHALNITNGQEEPGSPVVIKATITVNGSPVTFQDTNEMDRPGLLLFNGMLYIGFGSTGCHGVGWIMAYNPTTLQQRAVFNPAPTGIGTGIWQSGGGLSADQEGNIYFATADGPFDVNTGGQDYGDSMIKLTLTSSGFVVSDYFTPYDEAALNSNDRDLGASGLLIIPDQSGSFPHLLAGGGKGGEIYLVNRDNMGQFNPAQDNVVQEVANAPMFATPVYWNQNVYFTGQHVQGYSLNSGVLKLISQTYTLGTVYPPVISSNGSTNGILWVLNNNNLLAFNPLNLTQKYYDNTSMKTRDAISAVEHFATPMVANGRLYVGTTTSLAVFGLLPQVKTVSGDQQKGRPATALSQPLVVQAVDSYTGQALTGVPVTFDDGGAGGVLSATSVLTDLNGEASVDYIMPPIPGEAIIKVSSPGMVPAKFVERVQ